MWTILRLEKYKGDSLLQKTFIRDHISKKKVRNLGEIAMYYAKGTHPQIIEPDIFDAVQAEIARRALLTYRARKSGTFSCFTAKVFCAYCGATFRRRTAAGNSKRWKCGAKIDHKTACPSPYVPEAVLYEKSSEVIGIKEFSEDEFEWKVERIVVEAPNTLTFWMKDGREAVKRWH